MMKNKKIIEDKEILGIFGERQFKIMLDDEVSYRKNNNDKIKDPFFKYTSTPTLILMKDEYPFSKVNNKELLEKFEKNQIEYRNKEGNYKNGFFIHESTANLKLRVKKKNDSDKRKFNIYPLKNDNNKIRAKNKRIIKSSSESKKQNLDFVKRKTFRDDSKKNQTKVGTKKKNQSENESQSSISKTESESSSQNQQDYSLNDSLIGQSEIQQESQSQSQQSQSQPSQSQQSQSQPSQSQQSQSQPSQSQQSQSQSQQSQSQSQQESVKKKKKKLQKRPKQKKDNETVYYTVIGGSKTGPIVRFSNRKTNTKITSEEYEKLDKELMLEKNKFQQMFGGEEVDKDKQKQVSIGKKRKYNKDKTKSKCQPIYVSDSEYKYIKDRDIKELVYNKKKNSKNSSDLNSPIKNLVKRKRYPVGNGVCMTYKERDDYKKLNKIQKKEYLDKKRLSENNNDKGKSDNLNRKKLSNNDVNGQQSSIYITTSQDHQD